METKRLRAFFLIALLCGMAMLGFSREALAGVGQILGILNQAFNGSVSVTGQTANQVLLWNGSAWVAANAAGASFGNQNAHLFFGGPSSGVPAAPGFRALVASDLTASTLQTDITNGSTATRTSNDATSTASFTKDPSGAQGGSAIEAHLGSNATGPAILVDDPNNNGALSCKDGQTVRIIGADGVGAEGGSGVAVVTGVAGASGQQPGAFSVNSGACTGTDQSVTWSNAMEFFGGGGTGLGTGGSERHLLGWPAMTTGSSPNTRYDRAALVDKVLSLSTTTATVTSFCTAVLGSADQGAAGRFHYAVFAMDATGHHVNSVSGHFDWAASNENGTVTVTAGPTVEQSNAPTGTLTCSNATSVSGQTISFAIRPSWTTIVPTRVRFVYNFESFGPVSMTPQ